MQRPNPSRPGASWLLVGLATTIAVLGLAIFALFYRRTATIPQENLPVWLNAVQVLLAGGVGAWLLRGGRRDPRAFDLGGFFLIVASAYAGRYLRYLDGSWPIDGVLGALAGLQLGAWLPHFLLGFVAAFPDAPPSFRVRRWLRIARRVALWGGAFFFGTSVVAQGLLLAPASSLVALGERWVEGTGAFQWVFTSLLLIVATGVLIHKSRRSSGEERRRSKLFVTALAAAAGPVMLDLFLLITVPAYNDLFRELPGLRRWMILGDNLLIATVPVTTAYAVLIYRVLDVRLIARRALQHALARGTVHLLVWAPFALAGVLLYRQRHRTLVEIARGVPLLGLVATCALGAVALVYRERILDALDRHYFRERYNARRVLSQLIEQVRGCRSRRELANLLVRGIDLALHVERATLLIDDPLLGHLIDPKGEARPLDPGGRLATLVQGNPEPLELGGGAKALLLDSLPEGEVHWMVDQRVELLVPIFALDGGLLGLLVLGPRRNDLPYLEEDRRMIVELGSEVAVVCELLQLKDRSNTPPPLAQGEESGVLDFDPEGLIVDRPARECLGCGRVHAPEAAHCRRCELELADATIPFVLRRVFRFERRIGQGGMAVVYRATDLKLGRRVAIKTLPRVSADAAVRLHHEARAAAAVVHPGLAAIFGLETWEGTPLLIQEFLEGGTLSDRLRGGALQVEEVLAAGHSVALALHRIHTLGILHRDVKPSNIGFTAEGSAKLLDFGIAQLREDLRPEPNPAAIEDPSAWDATAWMALETPRGEIAGTLTYLSPEAIGGGDPHPTFDLWSLCVVLYEALTGENLFFGRVDQVLDAIRSAKVPDLRKQVEGCPDAVAEFFLRELHGDRGRRSQNGKELARRLDVVAERLAGSGS